MITRKIKSVVRAEGVIEEKGLGLWKVNYLYSSPGNIQALTYVLVRAKDELGAFTRFKSIFE